MYFFGKGTLPVSDSSTNLRYHLVFGTKNRESLITADVRDELYSYLDGIVSRQGGVLMAAGGMPDHVHLLVGLNPAKSLSEVMQHLKGSSSRWMNQRFPILFGWQNGYGAFSVSTSVVPAVRRYILRQEEHHRRFSFQEELQALLVKNGLEPNPNFLAG
jgi:REP element-mobilizing transposase RayT